jgi:hypothetical protein
LKEYYLTLIEKNESQTQLPILGVKAVKSSRFNSLHLVLRFNNDLYLYNGKTDETLLIDEDIIDFDTNTYIKENKWYYLYEFDTVSCMKNVWIKLQVKDTTLDFKHVAYWDDFVYATTDNTLYRLDITTKTVREYHIANLASSITGLNVGGVTDVSLLLSDGSLLLLTEGMSEVGTLYNIESVQGNIIKVNSEYHFCMAQMFALNKNHDRNLFSEIYSGVVSYPLPVENIINCVTYNGYDVCYFLTEEGLYHIDYEGKITNLILDNKKVKRITGNWEGFYVFY